MTWLPRSVLIILRELRGFVSQNEKSLVTNRSLPLPSLDTLRPALGFWPRHLKPKLNELLFLSRALKRLGPRKKQVETRIIETIKLEDFNKTRV